MHNNRPLVSSLSMAFKKATTICEDVDEVKKQHRSNIKILVDDYMNRVQTGKAEGVKTVRELVELIKADLLLLGEATERNEELSAIDQVKIHKITSVLDEDDPQVKAIMESLYDAMNGVNDDAGFVPPNRQRMGGNDTSGLANGETLGMVTGMSDSAKEAAQYIAGQSSMQEECVDNEES